MKDLVGREYKLVKPAKLEKHGPARVISMCNQKGGVGKTTSTINIAAAFAEVGRKVLIVDFDPQGAASVGLGVTADDLDLSVYTILTDPKVKVTDVIIETNIDNVDIIPANIDLSAAEMQLVTEVGRESILSAALEEVKKYYDLILIDCQPSLGLLTVNALTASDGVLIPLAAEYFALRGVALLVDTVEKVKNRLNTKLEIDGILPTMFDSRTLHSQEVVDSIYQAFGDKLLHSYIPRTVKFPDSSVVAEPMTVFAPKHPATEGYRSVVRELIANGAVQ